MTKKEAKKLVREIHGIIVKGRCQLNYHGCEKWSICWGEGAGNKWRYFAEI